MGTGEEGTAMDRWEAVVAHIRLIALEMDLKETFEGQTCEYG